MKIHLFLDFDGTITIEDVGDALFKEWGMFEPHHSRLLEGDISVADYYRLATSSLVPTATPEALSSWALTKQVDPGFVGLVEWARSSDFSVTVVSDGFNVYIEPILHAHFSAKPLATHCNALVFHQDSIRCVFPGATESCSCFCASCKRNVVVTSLAEDDVAVYVGDGRSDICAAQHADIVFAKGVLARECTERGIPHHPYRTLFEVMLILQQRLSTNNIHPRRTAQQLRKKAVECE